MSNVRGLWHHLPTGEEFICTCGCAEFLTSAGGTVYLRSECKQGEAGRYGEPPARGRPLLRWRLGDVVNYSGPKNRPLAWARMEAFWNDNPEYRRRVDLVKWCVVTFDIAGKFIKAKELEEWDAA